VLKLLKRYLLRPHWLMMAAILLATGLQVGAQLTLPNVMSEIVNVGILQRGVEGDLKNPATQSQIAKASNETQMNYILSHGATMLGIVALSVSGAVVAGWLCSRASAGLARDLREKIFARVESFSLREFDRFSTASLIIRSTNDVQQIQQMSFMTMRLALMAPMTSIIALIMAIDKGRSLAWIIAAILPILCLIIFLAVRYAMPLFRSTQKKTDHLNLIARESLTGVRVIRAFDRQPFQQARFEAANNDLTDTALKVYRMVVVMPPVAMLVISCANVATIWFGGQMVANGTLQIGDMFAFMQYAMQMLMSLMMLTMVMVMLPRASVSAERVSEVLNTQSSIKDPEKNGVSTEPAPGFDRGFIPATGTRTPASLQFKDVVFSFEGAEEAAICDLSFSAAAGTTTAIIGSTGSGKSTILNLIDRLYDVTSGSVLVNGLDVRQHEQHELHDTIGYIPQTATLFSGTIADNVRYGRPDASDDEVIAALKTAQAWEFVSQMEDGIESLVDQDGANFSGGQKQRVAIARALIKYPQIYLFDDSFSALDLATDAALRAALKPLLSDSLAVIVAQRISTIVDATQILVLEEGHLVGLGTHQELLRTNEIYRQIASSQLSADELALHSGPAEGGGQRG
jgi:ATP-binding cassette subfamily B protein